MTRRAIAVAGFVLLAPHVWAWPQDVVNSLQRDARRLLPRSLNRLLAEREKQILDAASRFPGELSRAFAADLEGGRLQPQTIAALETQAALSLEHLRSRNVNEGIVQLGALLRIPADLADPVLAAGSGGYAPGVVREYYAFVEGNLAKIPVVLDDPASLKLGQRDLPNYWQEMLGRSRSQSSVIGVELFKNGQVVSHRSLDYRSPVFAVASLSYSRAVTGIAATWLAVWREARGDLSRMPQPREVRPRDDHGLSAPPSPEAIRR